MAHHYTRDTTETIAWCNKCGGYTRHSVSDRRLAHCLQHAAPELSKAQIARRAKQKKQRENPGLFE